jgi:hypothetical protein
VGLSGELIVGEAAMAEADETLRALVAAYPSYAQAELDELWGTLEQIAAGERPADPDALFLPAHNLKGQGTSFGYDLITTLGQALCEKMRGSTVLTSADQSMIARLIDACRMVLAQGLTGDGGPVGSRLLAELHLQPS